MAQFFIHRPIFAWVLAIVVMLAGALGLSTLPVSQYPDIAPTTVRINASYPGATAEAVQNSVTRVIEDGLTGIAGVVYMNANSNEGSSRLTLTFDETVDPVDAQNEVQAKVQGLQSRLPDIVQQRGVSVTRSTTSILMVGALVATESNFTSLQLADILSESVEGAVTRIDGVGSINVFGSGYALRIWLDPLALAKYALTPSDVTSALQAQNTTVSVGSLGTQPTVLGQQFTATITAQSQLTSVAQFEAVLLKTEEAGGAVTLGDVARIEIGQQRYGQDSRFDGLPAAGFGVNLATGANAVDTAARVRSTLDSLTNALPEGVEIRYAYDTSPFVKLSIDKVYVTLAEAILLVFLVILVFLQNWRATLIPIIAVPVVLLGTFGVLAVFGYSINTLTMFAMVLAIGLLVDDAIVVVENVERVMEEDGLGPVDATEKSMGQITGALVGIALVLSAVFLPMAFFGGSTGVIYRQFSVTIITAMVLSALVALILTPALCASMLRPKPANGGIAPARWFNRNFDRMAGGYANTVTRLLRRPFWMILVLGAIGIGAWQFADRLNSSFLPAEDQGVLMTRISLSEGSTAAQTLSVVQQVEKYLLEEETEGVESVFAALGFGFNSSGQNTAQMFVKLKDFGLRTAPDQTSAAIAQRANQRFAANRAGRIVFNQPPAIPGLGNSAGFSMFLVDQLGGGIDALSDAADRLVELASSDDRLQNVDTNGNEDKSALRINIDQQKAESFGLSVTQVNQMLSVIFSGSEVNDFILGDSLRPVVVQGETAYRMQPDDIDAWYARNASGEMVPFPSFLTTEWVPVSPGLARFGGSLALDISGTNADSASSGDAMDAMEELAAQLPGYTVAWTGLSFQERQSGNQAPYLYALSILVVFLCLAALYESWTIPFSVMLAVPVGVLGALAAAWWFGQSNDVYFKVGILTTVGLAAKNAILIVEFAKELEAQGIGLIKATVQAARQRLRPILMTSFAFILGVVPLATATGAGAAAQKAIGIGVLGGMMTATFIGIFMVPSFYVIVRLLASKRKSAELPDGKAAQPR